jgi:hypothetical protein
LLSTLTFTEAPEPGDLIDVRQITTTSSVTSIANTGGNAIIATSPTLAQINITGNVVPVANVTYSLGSPTNFWNELYLSGNSIYLGDIILKSNNGNLKVRNFDDTADAAVEATFISTSTTSGNLQIGLNHIEATNANGNIELRPNGSGKVVVSTRLQIANVQIADAGSNTVVFYRADGTTPATISNQNIDATSIVNGTSSVSVIASGGNIRSNVGGTTVQTISTGLVSIAGDLSVSGNATLSGNILGDRVQNGTTSFDIQTPSGNANITVGVTSNVAVFSSTGANITGTLGVSGAITGASLSVSTGNITAGNLILSGAIEDSAQLDIRTTASNGNIVLTPNGTGVIVVAKDIVNGQANGVGNIGSATTYFNTVFAKATSAQYADLAEKYVADAEYAPGTVVVFGGDKEVTVTSTDADRAVAGVVSTNPSYIMNGGLEAEHVATVALTGRVPCRVTGTVRKGDLMVSAGYGLARAEADPRVGTVIGKALENHEGDEGVIEVVVGRF